MIHINLAEDAWARNVANRNLTTKARSHFRKYDYSPLFVAGLIATVGAGLWGIFGQKETSYSDRVSHPSSVVEVARPARRQSVDLGALEQQVYKAADVDGNHVLDTTEIGGVLKTAGSDFVIDRTVLRLQVYGGNSVSRKGDAVLLPVATAREYLRSKGVYLPTE